MCGRDTQDKMPARVAEDLPASALQAVPIPISTAAEVRLRLVAEGEREESERIAGSIAL